MDATTLDKALGLLDKFVQAALPVAKKAYETGLVTLQIDAAQSILLGLVWLSVAIFCLFLSKKMLKEAAAKQAANTNSYREADTDTEGWIFSIAAIVGTMTAFFSCWTLLDIWTWVKLFNPELWLVHTAIQKVL